MFQELEGGIGYFVASASLAYSSCLILHSVCANLSAANLQPVISLQFDKVSYRIFELEEKGGGDFHVLEGRMGEKFFEKINTLRLIMMHFGGTHSHSVLAHAQNNLDSTF